MSRQMPQNSRVMRELLTKYLEASKPQMNSKSDQVWIQGEIDRYTEQIGMITEGVPRKRQRKSTGMSRPMDSLGRIVIPKELRTVYDIQGGTPLEMFLDDETGNIVLQKFEPNCHFCNENTKDLTMFRGRRICETCLDELFNQV